MTAAPAKAAAARPTFPVTNAEQAGFAAGLGFAIQVLAGVESRRRLRLESVHAYLWPPIRLGQIEFAFNSHGAPLAFATWAFVTEQVFHRLTEAPGSLIELPDWNEGEHLWIVDVVAPYGGAHRLLRSLRKRVADHSEAFAIRHDRPGNRRRLQVCWSADVNESAQGTSRC